MKGNSLNPFYGFDSNLRLTIVARTMPIPVILRIFCALCNILHRNMLYVGKLFLINQICGISGKNYASGKKILVLACLQ